MKFGIIPPAGISVSLNDIVKLLGTRLKSEKQTEKFREIISNIAGVKHVFFVNSGRAANFIILKALKQLAPDRNEVIVPAYTCYSVPASIVRAGLKIRPVDIDSTTLDYDYDVLSETDFSKVLAILPCNLFGIVSDWKRINSFKADKAIFAIDDAAQTLGLNADGGVSGAMGDIGFYSLGRGKNMTTYSGGIILTNRDDLAALIESELAGMKSPGLKSEASIFTKLLLYGMLLNPKLYWLPNSLPFLRLGYTEYETDFEVGILSKLQCCFGPIMFRKLDIVNNIRKQNSNLIIGRIAGIGKFTIPGSGKGDIPYIRIPILAPDKLTRDKIITALGAIGVISSGMYPSSVARIPQIKEHLVLANNKFPGADIVVDRLFTLPTHSFVTECDIDKIVDCLKAAR